MWDNDKTKESTGFVTFVNDVEIELEFVTNDPVIIEKNFYGKKQWNFKVMENGECLTMSVTARRLLWTLEEYTPLEGRTLYITRRGTGMETIYEVRE